jgi:hypothetical protein
MNGSAVTKSIIIIKARVKASIEVNLTLDPGGCSRRKTAPVQAMSMRKLYTMHYSIEMITSYNTGNRNHEQ